MPTITQLRKPPSRAARAALAADHSAALDKAFFQRNPHRQYRARLATPEELAKLAACNAMPPMPDPSMQIWTCVKQIVPGFRQRYYRAAAVPPWLIHDVGERIARIMFESEEGNYNEQEG
jgi:hypothetical protein